MKHVFLTALLCLTALLTTKGQGDFRPGYYITLQHDSISVLVDYRSERVSSKRFTYKEGKHSPKKHFYPDEILAYGFNTGKRFTTQTITETRGTPTTVFMEHIVDGKMSLFQYQETFFVFKDTLYRLTRPFERQSSTPEKRGILTKKLYIGILNHLLSECNLSAVKTNYNETQITNLVQNYNRCKGASGVLYKAKLPKSKIHWQLFAGYEIAKTKTELPYSFIKSSSPLFGATVDLSAPRIFDKLAVTLETSFTKKLYQGYSVHNPSQTFTVRRDHFLNTNLSRIALGLRYSFLKEAFTPYIKAGGSYTIQSRVKYRVLQETEYGDGSVDTEEFTTRYAGKKIIGLWTGIGINKSVYDRYKVFIEVRFERSVDIFHPETFPETFVSENLSFITGIRF